jgi:hypothetical protein
MWPTDISLNNTGIYSLSENSQSSSDKGKKASERNNVSIENGINLSSTQSINTIERRQIPPANTTSGINKIIQDWIAKVISFFRTALSYINIFAYFKKAKNVEQSTKVQQTKVKLNQEHINQATQQLVAYFNEKANLNQVGIFREPGTVSKVKNLLAELEKSSRFNIGSLNPSPTTNDLASALKQWYTRHVCLFGTPDLREEILEVGKKIGQGDTQNDDDTIAGLKKLIEKLSDDQKANLKSLIEIFVKVIRASSKNKMTAENLGIAFGTGLAPLTENASDNEIMGELQDVPILIKVTTQLIIYYTKVFYVPEDQ